MSKTYEFKKRISEQDIKDILFAAMRGSYYWSGEWEIKENTENLIPVHELLTSGFSIRIEILDEDKPQILTLKKFLKGLSLMDKHDYYEYDMFNAEQVVQYALFGKQVYG